MSLTPGAAFGRYEICRPLGAGGMGEVYLAIDTRLGRPTALKLLAPKLMEQREYLHRFEQEARAISALNHPNIITIYEVGEVDGKHFIATEFINGETLRRHMSSARLPLREVLRLATQIGDALTAAHETGIAHRDIKPENVMLRGDGILKVLDFGLAKLMEKVFFRAADPNLPTIPNVDTTPGAIVGTVMYMSPEQLRGLKVDGRTDIWSLGVILHEMLAGRPPFEGRTNSDLIVSILEKEPAPLELAAPETPTELRRIVVKALAKNVEARYQTAAELTADLRRLGLDLEYAERQTPGTRPVQKRRRFWADTNPGRKVSTSAVGGGKAISSIEDVFVGIKKHPLLGAGALALLALCGFYLWRGALSPEARPVVQINNVTNSGRSTMAAVSPDGKYVVYAEGEGATQGLFVRHLSSTNTTALVPVSDVEYVGLTFSPGGDFVYFVKYEKTEVGSLYRIPLLGGPTTKLIEDIDGPVAFAPDAQQLAFVRRNESAGEFYLITADVNGQNARVVSRRGGGARFSLTGLSWSPGGNTIACAVTSWEGRFHSGLVEIDINSGAERKPTEHTWTYVTQIAWPRDGTGLYVCAAEKPMSPFQIWKVSKTGAEIEKVTNDLDDYLGLSLPADGEAIVTVHRRRASKIWVAQGPTFDKRQAILSGVGSSYGLSWAKDGRILTASMSGDNLNIFASKADGSDRRPLTVNAGDNYHPASSNDGRYIFFSSNRTGTFNLWRMDAQDGGNLKQLTDGEGDFHPQPLPGDEWVVYERQKGSFRTLWKVPSAGGEPVQLTEQYAAMPAVSPDGKLIACWHYGEEGAREMAVISVEGGRPLKIFSIPPAGLRRIRWTRDGNALTYVGVENGVANLMLQPLDGKAPRQLTDFQSEQIFSYDWSPDFSQLICERGTEFRDVALIEVRRKTAAAWN